jgi:hypothetical protein
LIVPGAAVLPDAISACRSDAGVSIPTVLLEARLAGARPSVGLSYTALADEGGRPCFNGFFPLGTNRAWWTLKLLAAGSRCRGSLPDRDAGTDCGCGLAPTIAAGKGCRRCRHWRLQQAKAGLSAAIDSEPPPLVESVRRKAASSRDAAVAVVAGAVFPVLLGIRIALPE